MVGKIIEVKINKSNKNNMEKVFRMIIYIIYNLFIAILFFLIIKNTQGHKKLYRKDRIKK